MLIPIDWVRIYCITDRHCIFGVKINTKAYEEAERRRASGQTKLFTGTLNSYGTMQLKDAKGVIDGDITNKAINGIGAAVSEEGILKLTPDAHSDFAKRCPK